MSLPCADELAACTDELAACTGMGSAWGRQHAEMQQ
jgi:hypothetical protein